MKFLNDREACTKAKTEFIFSITEKVKKQLLEAPVCTLLIAVDGWTLGIIDLIVF